MGVLTAASLALGTAGCGGGPDASGDRERGELTISAASSLTDAFARYGETTADEERFSFAGSDELAAQIRHGARPDVFASADRGHPDRLHDEGLASEPVVFAANRLVVAVPADSNLGSADELAEPGLDLVIGAEGAPIGDYTRELLGRLPRSEAAAILANVRSEESAVKGVVGKLVQGAADAGFAYASDVAAANGDLRAIELAPRLRPEVSYAIAVVAGAEDPGRARAFIDGLLAPRGRRILEQAGFEPVPAG